MDDMERYGDYNEVDEPPRKNPVLLFLKIVAAVICFAVIGIIAFRLFAFNYLPSSVTELYFTEGITEHYRNTGGNIGALTQNLRAPYDDEKEGNFFCDRLIVVPDIGELQITLRYNVSLEKKILEDYGIDISNTDPKEVFSFRLWKNGESEDPADHLVGNLAAVKSDSLFMYNYFKLAFDGIDFGEGDEKINWIRLEIFVNGAEMKEPFMVAIYENNEIYYKFEEYKLGSSEVPK